MTSAAQASRAGQAEYAASGPRHFLSLADCTAEEIRSLLDDAARLKAELRSTGHNEPLLAGQVAALIFQKPSLRTRTSFEVGMLQLGGHGLYLSPVEIQLGQREGVPDAAQVLSRYVNAIIARVYLHQDIVALARYASVPVINALTDLEHPCQILADLLTLRELRGSLDGLTVAYVGDGNNVANSWTLAAGMFGMQLRIATPDGFEPDADILRRATDGAQGGSVELLRNPEDAVRGADVVYTDTWYSMGQEDQAEIRQPLFRAYQVNEDLIELARPDALVMHCLPAHRGQEITDGVIDGGHSVVYEQAENRLHAQKALLVRLMHR